MIRITLCRNAADEIVSLDVSGHARYAKHGEDIVCAAVSMLTINTVNSISGLLDISLEPQSRDGFLLCSFPVQTDGELQSKMQLLLESMALGIQSIVDNYGKFVKYEVIYV